MDILFPCYASLTAAAAAAAATRCDLGPFFFQAPILINLTSRVVLGALPTHRAAPLVILWGILDTSPNLCSESRMNPKVSVHLAALPVVIIFSREQENGPPAEHGEIRGLGGGGGLRATQKALAHSASPPADPHRRHHVPE